MRETGVEQGLLVTDNHLRLTYSPQGETPGFLEWPIEGMKTTAGREMLAGFKLLLGKNAIWGSTESRLDGILQRSRENQNIVSTKLADQVLGALYSLLRGFTSEVETDTRLRAVAEQEPQEFYEGLLSVLMRLVFVLYAEDRGLMPSSSSEKAKRIYEQGYAVRRLFVDLESDAALYPDTMTDRYGAWGRLLGLFQLIHDGAGPDFMHQRRGKLFDPKTFPFLLGQFEEGDAPDVLPVSDKCIYDDWCQKDPNKRRPYPGDEYVLIHSLSHLLIEQISLEAGYPSTSLSERIYALKPEGGTQISKLGC